MLIEPLTDGSPAAVARLKKLAGRHQQHGSVEREVREIISAVERRGDRAVSNFTKRFDGAVLAPGAYEVAREDRDAALESLPTPTRRALESARKRIERFHRKQLVKSYELREAGIVTGMRVTALRRVGVYVPGGRASYPSTVLMNVVPALVAGVEEVVLVTPPDSNGLVSRAVLAAAAVAGAHRVFRIGGAQAIAALAFGTESVPRVDKIVGPGNLYVAAAKRLLFGYVDIDSIAGPSEVLIMADGRARPELVASDMLAQAEHDPMAAAICLTTSSATAAAVVARLQRQLAGLRRRAIAAKSLRRYGTVLVTGSMARAAELANEIAPEHLEVLTTAPRRVLPLLRNAGAVFLGEYCPESVGDYSAGPNHVLPTGGTARFASPLGVYDFVKRTSIIELDRRGLERLAPGVIELAECEGLEAHALAVKMRFAGGGK